MRYSKAFKEKAVKQVIAKKDTHSMIAIAKSLNISKATLYIWVKKAENSSNTDIKFTLSDKLQILKETYNMNEEVVNTYCREKGIFKHQIEEWEKGFLSQNIHKDLASNKALEEEKSRSHTLAKELRRKEKALAETATLLVLQKKFQALLEGEDQ